MEKVESVTLAYVRWFDCSYQQGEHRTNELVTRVDLHSGGLLVREDDESISIALDRYDDDDTWRHIQHIPKVNVISIQRFPVEQE